MMEPQTHGARKYPTSTLLKSSAGLGWSTISAELRSHGICETPVIVPQHVELCLTIEGNNEGLLLRTVAGRRHQIAPTSGMICISPIGIADNAITSTVSIPKELHLYLPAALFRRLSDDFNLPGKPGSSIRYASGVHDGIIEQIGRSILSEMTDETSAGRMFVETASLTLAARLLHTYGDSGSAPFPPASHKLDHARLRRVLDYISTHLAEEITVSNLAGVAGLSTFHFARMFTLAVGVSPHRYVSRMRLERALAEIAEGKLPLAKIAFDARFSSQASFTRAFRRATAMTPGEYRRARRGSGDARLKGRLETAHPAPLAPIWIETLQSDNPVSTAKAVKTMAGAGQTRARAAP